MEFSNDPGPKSAAARNWLDEALRPLHFFAGMRERRQIRRICVEFLTLYRQVEGEMPQASQTELYTRIIQRRSGADPHEVQRFMRRAAESFAAWPVDRPLNFRDIVQYIAVTDCLKTDIAVDGVRSRIVETAMDIVPTLIPAHL